MDNNTEEEKITLRGEQIRRVLFGNEKPDDYIAFLEDNKGSVYLSLHNQMIAIAMITPKTIRYRNSTNFKDIFNEFAKKTKRKVFCIDSFRCRRGFDYISYNTFMNRSGIITEVRSVNSRPDPRQPYFSRAIDVDMAPVGVAFGEITWTEGVNTIVQDTDNTSASTE